MAVLFAVAVLSMAWLDYEQQKVWDQEEKMSAGWVNAIVLVSILLIVAGAIAIGYIAATRRGGRKTTGLVKPDKAQYRQVNPKTGDLFP